MANIHSSSCERTTTFVSIFDGEVRQRRAWCADNKSQSNKYRRVSCRLLLAPCQFLVWPRPGGNRFSFCIRPGFSAKALPLTRLPASFSPSLFGRSARQGDGGQRRLRQLVSSPQIGNSCEAIALWLLCPARPSATTDFTVPMADWTPEGGALHHSKKNCNMPGTILGSAHFYVVSSSRERSQERLTQRTPPAR
jgi:hypothetical protein